jgi:lactoylglutathione lyase
MITGIVHGGITVKNLEESIKFYRDVLGLELIKREPPRTSRAEQLGVPGAVLQIAVFAVPNTTQTLELLEYLRPERPNEYGHPVNSVGQVHIAFQVDDIEKTIENYKKYNVNLASTKYETIKEGPIAGWKWVYLKDPDGTNLEIIEVTKDFDFNRAE